MPPSSSTNKPSRLATMALAWRGALSRRSRCISEGQRHTLRHMPTTSDVAIRTEQGLMPAYCAVPSTRPPWPGVVVIHDFTGMSHDLRAQADWLANEGFLAVAPDLYYWGTRLRCLRTIMRDVCERRGRTFDDIEAAR
jgi:carboxymethylenebutenolidase